MEQAIKKAIEGGWKPRNRQIFKNCKNKKEVLETFNFCYPDEDSIKQHRHYFDYFSDPLFWQALGKAEGWVTKDYKHPDDCFCGHINCDKLQVTIKHQWKEKWHHFIDHLASGKDIDSFFKELLK